MFDPAAASKRSQTPGAPTLRSPPTPDPARPASLPPPAIPTFAPALLQPLSALPVEVDDPLRPRATIFMTPLGRELLARIPAAGPARAGAGALQEITWLETATETRHRIADAARGIAQAPAPAVLLLGGGHHMASSLTMFHAAIDACRRHGLLLCLEHSAESLGRLDPLVRYLQHEPVLQKALGRHTLHSRKGQAIAWDYVRSSDDRGLLQRLLPEVLAWNEIGHSGLRIAHVDPLGIERGSDRQREEAMSALTCQELGSHRRGLFLGGLAHITPIHAQCVHRGVHAQSLAVFDETADDLQRLYDADAACTPRDQARDAAHAFRHNLALPPHAATVAYTQSVRVGFEQHPFS